MKLAWSRARAARTLGLDRVREMTLFDFRAPEDRAEVDEGKWRVWSDEVMGGKSTCTFESSEEEGGKAIFKGSVSQYVPRGTSRSGFAAVQLVMPEAVRDVTDFDALCLRIKLDKSKYTVNVKPDSIIPDDLYQGFLMQENPAMHGEWFDAILPFDNFLLMGRGLVKQDQRSFDYRIIDALGFSASDFEGDFHLEIQSAKAIISWDEDSEELIRGRTQNLKPSTTTTSF
mmetsp:Transcript_4181/g.9077  ORF Transcript_4181/g.9077 Transcript_4181/m.9077 type:complete len:229 (-) Transcript_4181:134-820(-)|eukprot:CAMPEP_0171521734 /NCGR_PEP_ID=MMETSP0959-20130129/7310_1 /TAXON_ID=87120 /ORGANISM="Aurantiochytrium limacinum, Strain ATCCMYA-1381" /LENGTH=228 /DNA_ID=CAMNT_0012061695 /DNA_START=961 /DNA_END=1647 /DNA_ORIENTATION=+